MMLTDLDGTREAIAQINNRLKAAGLPVRVRQRGKLWFVIKQSSLNRSVAHVMVCDIGN